jgi:hypothetical protein
VTNAHLGKIEWHLADAQVLHLGIC